MLVPTQSAELTENQVSLNPAELAMEFRIIFDAEIRRLVETRQNFSVLGSRTTSPWLFDEEKC